MPVVLVVFIFYLLIMNSCYYDSEEYLYPKTACTDTVDTVKYSTTISSILSQNCLNCHTGANSTSGIDLSTYPGVLIQVKNSKLLNSISPDGNVPHMPLTGGQLDNCELGAITKWINAGAPDN